MTYYLNDKQITSYHTFADAFVYNLMVEAYKTYNSLEGNYEELGRYTVSELASEWLTTVTEDILLASPSDELEYEYNKKIFKICLSWDDERQFFLCNLISKAGMLAKAARLDRYCKK